MAHLGSLPTQCAIPRLFSGALNGIAADHRRIGGPRRRAATTGSSSRSRSSLPTARGPLGSSARAVFLASPKPVEPSSPSRRSATCKLLRR